MSNRRENTAKIRISSCKIAAKKIINENMGKCIGSSLLIIGPKLLLLLSCIAFYIFLSENYALLASAAALLLFVPLNSFCTAAGELTISRIVDDNYVLMSDECDKMTVFKTLKELGILKLIKLRFLIIIGIVSDTLMSALPVAVIAGLMTLFIRSSSIPTAAFFVSVFGLFLIIIIAFAKIALERDKYRFVYCDEALLNKETVREIIKSSSEICSERADWIFKCENSFMRWALIEVITLPLLLPFMYFDIYKRVTMNVIRMTSVSRETELQGDTQEIIDRTATMVFNIS